MVLVMELIRRNIVILLDKSLTKEFIQLSEKINSKVLSEIILNTTTMLPHITLYTTNYPTNNEDKIIKTLEHITKDISSFPISLTTPVIDMLGVWINAEKTPIVQKVHEQIVDGLNGLREDLYDEKELIAIGDDKKRQESLVKYGMWAAKELYIPHITLSRPVDSLRLEEALRVLPEKVNYQTNATEIAYVERGPFGTCKKILQTIPLK